MCRNGKRCSDTPRKKALRLVNDRLRRAKRELGLTTDASVRARIAARIDTLEMEHDLLVAKNNSNFMKHETEDQINTLMDKVAEMSRNSDVAGMQSFMDARSNTLYFTNMIKLREEARAELKRVRLIYDVLSGRISERKMTEEQKDMYFAATVDSIRSAAIKHLETYEELQYLNYRLNQYRAPTAYAAQEISRILDDQDRAAGTFLEYTDDTLNNLVAIGAYVSGSREWLESRQNGIGGSDVGAILKVDPDYGAENYREVFDSKVLPITDEMVEEQSLYGTDFSCAVGRGNAWEEYIRRMFAERNPDLNVAFCKTSWRHSQDSYRHGNFDGLILDDDGRPVAILEIKTGADPSKWGPERDGFDGLPDQYKCQVLWYMINSGINHGYLAAVIDDTEYRQYEFTLDDNNVQNFIDNIESLTAAFWKKVQDTRASGEERQPVIFKNFPKSNIARNEFRKLFEVASVYREETPKATADAYFDILEMMGFGSLDEIGTEGHQKALRVLYSSFNPASRKKNLVGIDIEASSLGPAMGRIIETGVTVRSPQGEVLKTYSSLHGIPEKAIYGVGVGAEEVHHISLEDIQGQKSFEDPENQREILELLKGGIMVAHNAPYETNFLKVHLKGFAQAYANGEITILDTMQLARNLMLDTPNNKLEWFAKGNGIDYVDAHRALNDAEMMMDALFNFQNSLHSEYLEEFGQEYESMRLFA